MFMCMAQFVMTGFIEFAKGICDLSSQSLFGGSQ